MCGARVTNSNLSPAWVPAPSNRRAQACIQFGIRCALAPDLKSGIGAAGADGTDGCPSGSGDRSVAARLSGRLLSRNGGNTANRLTHVGHVVELEMRRTYNQRRN